MRRQTLPLLTDCVARPFAPRLRTVLLAMLIANMFNFGALSVHAAPSAPPIAVADDRLDQPIGTPVLVNVLANDIDADNDLDLGTVRIFDPTDLNRLQTRVVVNSEGIWQVNTANGNITFSPCTQSGQPDRSCTGILTNDPFPIEYSVADKTGLRSNPAIVTITLNADASLPPIIVDDRANTPSGQPVTIDVLANDSDPDGTLNPSSVTIAAAPAHGSANPTPDGLIIYTPTGNYVGPDQFTYRVCNTDPTPECATANVRVTVTPPAENRPPIVVNDTPPAIAHDQTVTIDVLANDNDPDGQLDKNAVSVTSQAQHGAASPATDGSGAIRYTPFSGYSGSDQFRYQVCDNGSPTKCASATVFLTILPSANQAPTAVDDQASTKQDRAVTIPVLSNDRDPEGALDPASLRVTENPVNGQIAIDTANGSITYTPAASFTGVNTLSYTVCDQAAPPLCSNEATVRVLVSPPTNQPPVALNDNAATRAGQPVTINVLVNDGDPEGALDPGSVAVKSNPANGQVSKTANNMLTYTPSADFIGRDSFTYEVCDTATPPLCATATVTVIVSAIPNEAPVAVNDSIVMQQGQSVTIYVLGNDNDPDGALDPASIAVKNNPANGLATVNSDGSINYASVGNFIGRDFFTYEVCDNAATPLCDTATVTVVVVTIPNQAPVAVNDNATTRQGQAVTVKVLSNDSDPDGALNPLSVNVQSSPANGQANPQTDGAIIYTPEAAFTGSDSFAYEVCDNAAAPLCDTATVTVAIEAIPNQAPVAVNDNATTRQGQTVTIVVLSNDSDPDGTLNAFSVKVKSDPANGQAKEEANGSIRYTPSAGFVGSDSFTYEVCDDAVAPLCDSATVAVTVAAIPNKDPMVIDDNATTLQDQAITVDVLANDADPEDALDPSSLRVDSGPGNGQASVGIAHTITYTPTLNFVGDDSFSYRVCDSASACGMASVNIVVISPSISNTIYVVDDLFGGLTDQPITGNILTNDSDPEGDALLAPVLDGLPANGTVEPFNADGSFTYTPNPGFSGGNSFTYQLCDTGVPQACGSATVTITITAPANLPPVAVDDAAYTRPGRTVSIDVLANDFDTDGELVTATLTISGSVSPGSATVVGEMIEYVPDTDVVGDARFQYEICDNGSPAACDTATVVVAVAAAGNVPPIAVNDAAYTRPGRTITVDVLANDVDLDGQLVTSTLVISGVVSPGSATVVGDAIEYMPDAENAGQARFRYEICDDGKPAACDAANVVIDIVKAANVPPIAVDDAAYTRPGKTVTIDVLANDIDLDGDLVASTLVISGVVSPGEATVLGGAIQYVPDADSLGDVRFAYTICDDGEPAACDSATVIVTVATADNLPPTAVPDNVATLPNQPIEIDVLANDVDADGSLDPASLAVFTEPSNGQAAVSTGKIVYTPSIDFSGLDAFTYQVCDDAEPPACNSATVNVTVIAPSEENEAYAFNDGAYVRAGESVTGNVLSNDLDPENDGWQTPEVETPPSQGIVELAAGGTFTYTANLTFVGIDRWTYQVCDLGEPEACARAVVQITVAPANNPPNAVGDWSTARVNTSVSGNLLTNDSDPDGDVLAMETSPATEPTAGEVTLESDGQFTYTPDSDFTGADTFSYRVCDPDQLCDTATVTIDVRALTMANAAPYAADDQAVTRPKDPVKIVVLANDGDLDGVVNPATVSIVTEPGHGLAMVGSDGTIVFTPASGRTDKIRFSYRVCDNGAPVLCTTANVAVEIAAAGSNTTYAFEDAAWGRTGASLQTNLLTNDFDLEGDTQLLQTTPISAPSHGRLILATDGAIVYTPDAGYVGSDRFVYQVCDDGEPQACTQAGAIMHVFPPNLGWDFGDAPSFSTSLATDGPRHAIVAGLRLGDRIDAESDGVSNDEATTDDQTDLNDESIIAVYPDYAGGNRYSLDVPVTNLTDNGAQLVGWIDWNANFSFEDQGERSMPALAGDGLIAAGSTDDTFATANVPAGFDGVATLTWNGFSIPAGQSETKMVRLRLAGDLPGSAEFFADPGPSTTGPATGGTVIDTLAPISSQSVVVSSFTASPAADYDENSIVDFAWVTLREENVDGFNLLHDSGSGLEPINDTLIPSQETNSTEVTQYSYSAPTEGDTFYLQIVMLSGEVFLQGPIRLGSGPPELDERFYFPVILSGPATKR